MSNRRLHLTTTEEIQRNLEIAVAAAAEFRQIIEQVSMKHGQMGMADMMGCDNSLISRMLRGERAPSRNFVERFCEVFVGEGPEGARERDRIRLSAGYAPRELALDYEDLAATEARTEPIRAQLRALNAILSEPGVPGTVKVVILEAVDGLAQAACKYLGRVYEPGKER